MSKMIINYYQLIENPDIRLGFAYSETQLGHYADYEDMFTQYLESRKFAPRDKWKWLRVRINEEAGE